MGFLLVIGLLNSIKTGMRTSFSSRIFYVIFLIFSAPFVCASEALKMPQSSKGLGVSLYQAASPIADRLWDFFISPGWVGFINSLLGLTMVVGLVWRGRKIMAGEAEVGAVLWGTFFRVCVTAVVLGGFMNPAYNLGSALMRCFNSFSSLCDTALSPSAKEDDPMNPMVKAKIVELGGRWLAWREAVTGSSFGDGITSKMSSSTMSTFISKMGASAPKNALTLDGTMYLGFPGVSYIPKSSFVTISDPSGFKEPFGMNGGFSHPAYVLVMQSGVVVGVSSKAIPKPRPSYFDVFSIYSDPLIPRDAAIPIRPLVPAVTLVFEKLVQSGLLVKTVADWDRWLKTYQGAASELQIIEYTYIRDYGLRIWLESLILRLPSRILIWWLRVLIIFVISLIISRRPTSPLKGVRFGILYLPSLWVLLMVYWVFTVWWRFIPFRSCFPWR